jgi:hypothetical protein
VTADHRVVAARAILDVEPRRPAVMRIPRLSLECEHHGALVIDDADASHRVHHHPQPVPSFEAIAPASWLVAVHAREKFAIALPAKRRFDFSGELLRPRHAPLRKQTRVHQGPAILHVNQGAGAQPVE